MNINHTIPFYSNTSDNLHCFQACMRMVLKYFCPEREYTYEELDKKTGFIEGHGTWTLMGMLWLESLRFDVKDYEIFDYKKFVLKKEEYLLEFYGEELGRETIKNTNIQQEVRANRKLLRSGVLDNSIPSLAMFEKLLNRGYLIISLVYYGNEGHFVVVKGIENDNLILNDPGLPGKENKKMKLKTFREHWEVPNVNGRNILAIKKILI